MTCLSPAQTELEILPSLGEDTGPSSIEEISTVHDLGNLIQIAFAAINILLRMPERPVEHTVPLLRRAKTSLEHAGDIIRQNLSRARGDHGELCAVGPCLSEVADLALTLGDALSFKLRLSPNLGDIRCDPTDFRRAVLNLVLNARDAMGGGGTIQLDAFPVTEMVEIHVTDHGIGMAAETIERLFDPSFTTKSDGLGGIGMPMVAKFVRSVGGNFAVRSEVGVGTSMIMRLPAALRQDTLPGAMR